MRGLLKAKPAGTQLLILISIALVSFFLFGLLGTVVLSGITGINLMSLSDSSKWDFTNPGIITFIRGMQVVQFIALFLVPTFLGAWLFSTDSKKYLGIKKPSNLFYFIAAVAVMILAVPLVNWLGELNKNVQFPSGIEKWMRKSEEEAAKTVQALLSKHTIKDLIINILCIAGLAAVGEELLFRGIAQRLFIKIFKSPWVGIIIAAILFSAMHLQFYGFLPRFILGIFLGIIFWYSGSLWTSIVAHFIYDATLIVLVYFNPSMIKEETPVKLNNIALMAALSFVIVALIIGWMKKKSTATYKDVYADDAIPVKDHPF
ncbi:MAG: type II CAAX endopeptidase family protein [Bacteroidota bacterium]